MSKKLADAYRLLVVACLFLAWPNHAEAQEKSVNPGINKSFEGQDIQQWVERFEREGREVFDRREAIVKACGVKPGMAVADIGAGTGLFTRLFADAVGENGKVFAVDITARFVESVEKSCQQSGLNNVQGIVCAADDAKLAPNSVDLIFICDTYHHFEYPYKTVASLHKALKPDGRLILLDFRRVKGESSEWIMGHVRAGQEVFTKEVVDSGFVVERREDKLLKDNYFVVFKKAGAAAP